MPQLPGAAAEEEEQMAKEKGLVKFGDEWVHAQDLPFLEKGRIKAEEEIWNKVVDEIFEVDSLVERDKELRHLSRYVKKFPGRHVRIAVAR